MVTPDLAHYIRLLCTLVVADSTNYTRNHWSDRPLLSTRTITLHVRNLTDRPSRRGMFSILYLEFHRADLDAGRLNKGQYRLAH